VTVFLVKTLVNSKVTYGYELLAQGSGRLGLLETLQVQAGRKALGLTEQAPAQLVLAELGLVEMRFLAARAVVLLANKIVWDTEDTLTRHLITINENLGIGFAKEVETAMNVLQVGNMPLGVLKNSYLAVRLKKDMEMAQKVEWRQPCLSPDRPLGYLTPKSVEWGPEPGLLRKCSSRSVTAWIRFRAGQMGVGKWKYCRCCGRDRETSEHLLLECQGTGVGRLKMYEEIKVISGNLHCLLIGLECEREQMSLLLGGARDRIPLTEFVQVQETVAKYIEGVESKLLKEEEARELGSW
jgi:hypothetical protein